MTAERHEPGETRLTGEVAMGWAVQDCDDNLIYSHALDHDE